MQIKEINLLVHTEILFLDNNFSYFLRFSGKITANVSRLEAVGVKEAFTFGLRLNFANTKPTSNYALNPQLLQTAVI